MGFIKWLPEYETGLVEVDKQHRALIEAINKLHVLLHQDFSREELKEIIDFLNEYVVEHFGTEEKLMRENPNFPEKILERHLKEHRYFIDRIQEFTGLFEDQETPKEALLKLFEFLGNWFCEHILRIDKETASFLK